MKNAITAIIMVLSLPLPAAFGAEVPKGIAGLILGKDVKQLQERVVMASKMPLRHAPYIYELETAEIPGYRYGLVWITDCATPDVIVRIKLKYEDSSKKFYNQLLKRYKNRFGDPSEWQGDPFHILLAWKWSFTDEQGNRISLVLQHNTRDEEESIGNTVKMTMWNRIEEERSCHRRKQAAEEKKKPSAKTPTPAWDLLVPR